jgi:hypothetical protein
MKSRENIYGQGIICVANEDYLRKKDDERKTGSKGRNNGKGGWQESRPKSTITSRIEEEKHEA